MFVGIVEPLALTHGLQTRNREFAGGISLNNTDNEHGTYTWGNSIWNSKPARSGFGSTPRDGSRTRGTPEPHYFIAAI